MEFFFADPNVERTPPKETRLIDLRAEPDPDGKRIRVAIECTPFQKRPYLEVVLTDPSDQVIASASIIEPMAWKLEITLHIRKPIGASVEPNEVEKAEKKPPQSGPYTLTTSLSYPEIGQIDQRQITVARQP